MGIRHTIKLDYDDKFFPCVALATRLNMAADKLDFFVGSIRVMESKKGFHVYITVKGELSDMELCFIQLLLLSDWKRELLNARRTKHGRPMTKGNKLFQYKYKTVIQDGKVINSKLKSKEVHTAKAEVYEKAVMEIFQYLLSCKNEDSESGHS